MSTAPSNFHEISSPEQFQEILSADLGRVSLLNFWAPWAEPCTQMNEVVLELAKKYPQLLVLQVEAESQADISESFEIEAVPSFIILRVCLCDPWNYCIVLLRLLYILITIIGPYSAGSYFRRRRRLSDIHHRHTPPSRLLCSPLQYKPITSRILLLTRKSGV